ncbi:hypothetical protein J5N97_025389 [Dioscorea zingiberensis]|uniref:Endoglucanase n=1 Tax=Dioscorea zingiberensis TaxID=325984 RepID=A0A9D5C9H2_9LILI|nr:hypothetical protein J5N97_025389 [Dioscorea zingiberensis]
MKKVFFTPLVIVLFTAHYLVLLVSSQVHDYHDALSKSILFFEGQRSGKLPPNQRLTWRADSAVGDGSDAGVDLSGGYYDAGDNVKFGFPMAFTTTMLAWSLIEFGDSMPPDEHENATVALLWATDYLLKTISHPGKIFVQVGDPLKDHNCWERPEDMDTARTVYTVSEEKPGSDIAGETAAALAASSMFFRSVDNEYSEMLLQNAVRVFEFADAHKGAYSDDPGVRAGVCPFYCDFDGYQDELLWGAAWLRRASQNDSFLSYIQDNGKTLGADDNINEFGWDNKHAGLNVLVSKEFLEAQVYSLESYKASADSFMCTLVPESSSTHIRYTPGGLIYKPGGSNMQHVTSIAFLLLSYANYLAKTSQFVNCGSVSVGPASLRLQAKKQVDYLLGDNPMKMSYMVGYGERYPLRVHHRGSSLPSKFSHPEFIACKEGSIYYNSSNPNPNLLIGAVVGGPGEDDVYEDDRADFRKSEPTTYINAPLGGRMGTIGEDELARWEKTEGGVAAGIPGAGGGSGEERILVSVRLRPLNSIEISRNDPADWEYRVFGHQCTTRQVYVDAARDVALSVVNGINSSIFAYGQTSSGKTYTMTGITEYSVADIYDYIEKHEEREFVLKFSAMEIYNEAVRDLLSSDGSPLRLLDDPERGTIVDRLTEETLRDLDHLKELLSVCEAQRQIGETSMNEMSSRSHQILRLTIESSTRQFLGKENFSSLSASVNFIDLAGSERASQALSAGTRLKEGCHINRSLLTLGTVIRKLRFKADTHIAIIASGNARTAIICTMSPARSHIEQSRNTLLFATCAKEVATSAKVNVVMSDKALVKHLQKELARLESELRCPNLSPNSSHSEALKERDSRIKKMEKEIKELIEQRDLAQSRLDGLLQASREWDEVSQHSACNAENTYEDMISISEASGVDHQSQDSSVLSFDSTVGSHNCKEIQSEQCETQKEENSTSPKYNPELVYHQRTEEGERNEYADFDDICKEVQCIEMTDNKRNINEDFDLLLTEETEFLVPVIVDTKKTLKSDVDLTAIEEQVDNLKENGDESSPLLLVKEEEFKNLKTSDELPPLESRSLGLSRSRSCRARLMDSCSTSPSFLEKIEPSPSPYLKERRQSALELSAELENLQELKNNSNEVLKKPNGRTASKEDVTSISGFVDGLKEMAKIHYQDTERTISEDFEEKKTVRDVCLQPVISPSESPSRWPIEFAKKQQEIIELWHACNVSLIHRTYFFLLFKGDPADSFYIEVEQRRLSFLKNTFSQGDLNRTSPEDGQKITLASSIRNLRREREMLCRQMQKRMSAIEREELYSKWGISLQSKRRRMQLAKQLWSETKDMEHVKESASIVAKLIGLLEPEHALKEMFGLSFTPQLAHRRSFSWKNGMSSIK